MSRFWLSLLLVALVGSLASAQGVMRKSERKMVNGEVTEMSATEVTFKPTNNKPVEKIPANDVLYIQWKSEPAAVGLARSSENQGKYDNALKSYDEALKVATDKDLKTELEWAIARTKAKQAATDPSKADAAIAALNDFKKAHADHYASFQVAKYLGEVNMAKGDAAAARTAYEQLAKAPWKDFQLTAEIAGGKLLLQEGKLDDAAAAFDKVISGATPAEETQRQEALLGKSKVLIAQSKFPEATALLDEVLAKSSPEDTALQAEAYVRQGDCLQAQGKTKEALLAYLHVDVLFDHEAAWHAEALYHLAQLWTKDGKPPRSNDASSRLQQSYPSSEWAKKAKSSPTGG